MKIKKLISIILLITYIHSTVSYAEQFKINNIQVIGLQKVDEGVVLSALPIEPGESFDTNDTSQYIKDIYKTGYFQSITINRDRNNLIIKVTEKPSIASIKIVGNDSFETDKLNEALGSIGIKENGTYNEFTLEKLKQELEQQYINQGKYSVKIKTKVTALERNRVSIDIDISEGKVAKIKEIRIIGNNHFSKEELVKDFALTEGGMFTWFTFSDRYSKQKLSGDLELLKSFYLDRGYLNFTIEDAQISITPDKHDVYIVLQVNEGEIYKLDKVNLGGRLGYLEQDIKNLVTIKTGDVYSAKDININENNILNELGRNGYLFAKIDINKNINETNKTANVTFFVEPGKRVYVRRITFLGNIKTQDEVLRREILQMEGGYISREKIELSKQRLSQLGYIKDINVETIPVSGSNDQVDLKYSLAETNTGHFNGGVGYVEKEGFMFSLGVTQDNFFGTGKNASVNFNKSKAATSYSMGYFDPYFTVDGIGLGYNVYYNKSRLSELDISSYKLDMYGLDLTLRIPVSLFDLISFSMGGQNKTVHTSANSAQHIVNFVDKHGHSYNLFQLGGSWQHTKLDRALLPTKGWKNQLSANVTIPGSDLNYYLLYNTTKLYVPISNEFILYLKGSLAYGESYHDGAELPFFENYLAGGSGTVRGFVQNSLGPRDSRNDPMGGNALASGTAELFLPRLFASNAAWRPSLFIDAGNVFHNKIELDELRVAGGVGMQWLSPLGLLSLSYAKPIKKFSNDQVKSFNFNFGSSF